MEIYDAYGKREAEKFYVVISFFYIHPVPQKVSQLNLLRDFCLCYFRFEFFNLFLHVIVHFKK